MEVARSGGPIPFLQYSPRRRQVAELLLDAERWRDRVHLIQGSRRLTFGDLFLASGRVAGKLVEQGLKPGDRLLLLAPNSPEWVTAFWAGIRAGAVVTLGNGWWNRAEAEHAVELVQPSLVIADERRRELLPSGLTDNHLVVLVDQVRLWGEADSTPSPVATGGDENDPAVIIFTAGTTGDPKAAVLAHRSVIANLHSLLLVSGRLPQQIDPEKPGAVILQSGPMFHIGGIQALLLAMLCGHSMVFLEGRFDAGQVLDLIEREHVTVWGAVPTMAFRVLEHPSLPGRDLSAVRSISLGGAAVQPELTARLRRAFTGADRGLSTIYGMTETGGTVASASGQLMAAHPRTSGRPTPVSELRIDSPQPGGEGEILVRTPGQMLGYWGARADIIDGEGWVHTGDLGHIEDGLLYVTGRSKDIIIRGGENIASAHVESALLRHPAVRNAAVVARPDADLGERVGAAIELDPSTPVTAEDLAEFGRTHLANHEVPTDWWLMTDQLPMSEAGKVDKRKLSASWPPGLAVRTDSEPAKPPPPR